ncbi:MAG: META domain-containing protein [Lacibacter sp.]
MRHFLTAFVFVFLMVSCRTENANNAGVNTQLTGTWQLTEVNDKSTGTTITYPSGTTERIQITLNADGSFSGKTRVNIFSGGSYTLPSNGTILFGSFGSMTKVAEDQLGSAFLTVLQNCLLQSVFPCVPATYSISGNRMEIKTTLRYDAKLIKL